MLPLTWTWLLAPVLLAGQGGTQSCRPELQGIARKAVDGNCDGDFSHASCTHTKLEKEPWWHVDLGNEYAISAVVVTSCRNCWCESLQGAEIHVGNSLADHGKSNPLCGNVTDLTVGSISTIFCQQLKGRYISVNIPGRKAALTLCEVEVYGAKLGAKC